MRLPGRLRPGHRLQLDRPRWPVRLRQPAGGGRSGTSPGSPRPLLPLLDDDQEQAVALAVEALERLRAAVRAPPGRPACGPSSACPTDLDDAVVAPLVDDLLALLQDDHVDYTSFFRASARPHAATPSRPGACSSTWPAIDAWLDALARPEPGRRRDGPGQPGLHPAQPPRRGGPGRGDRRATWTRSDRLLDAVTAPYDERPGLERYAAPAPADFGAYRTFCGT